MTVDDPSRETPMRKRGGKIVTIQSNSNIPTINQRKKKKKKKSTISETVDIQIWRKKRTKKLDDLF
jgi:hypothetical protein